VLGRAAAVEVVTTTCLCSRKAWLRYKSRASSEAVTNLCAWLLPMSPSRVGQDCSKERCCDSSDGDRVIHHGACVLPPSDAREKSVRYSRQASDALGPAPTPSLAQKHNPRKFRCLMLDDRSQRRSCSRTIVSNNCRHLVVCMHSSIRTLSWARLAVSCTCSKWAWNMQVWPGGLICQRRHWRLAHLWTTGCRIRAGIQGRHPVRR
jgi:hypothetical protein